MDFTDFEKEAIKILDGMPKSRSRNCFRSALRHLEKSHLLLNVDLEMAAFRAITAEEEAASGLMYCLKELNYPGSEKLNPRIHSQKNAVTAFLKAVGHMPAELQKEYQFEFILEINKHEPKPLLGLAIKNSVHWPEHKMRPEPPLGFIATTGEKVRSFAPYLAELASKHEEKDFLSHIDRLANYRNRLLYADEMGIPMIKEIPSGAVEQWKSHVISLLYGYLLIKPYKEHQLFVSQLLSSFLVALQKIPIGDLHPDS
jgi:hypothetical protein